jgi:hypothetical protein
MVFSILSTTKSFDDRWVGHPTLNRWGLHRARVKAARAARNVRRWMAIEPATQHERELLENGVTVIPNFLPDDIFQTLAEQAKQTADAVREATPYPNPTARGFGKPQHHDWGLDRFDGSTLNRLIDPSPPVQEFGHHTILNRMAKIVTGRSIDPGKCRIYETISHAVPENPDIQAAFHRDTFFDSMKYWFYLEEVTEADGPLTYVPGSHHLGKARMDWEDSRAQQAIEARQAGKRGSMGGAFRITEAEIAELGLPDPVAYTVRPNTLIVANVFGFHRRGDAQPGTRRLSLYGNHRPQPFLPFGA